MKNIFFILILLSFSNILIAQNGIMRTYYSSGNVESRVAFVKDVLEGTSYWYYENGNIKTEKNYSDGKLNGLVRNYYEIGLLKDESNFTNGMLNGVSKKYYGNGGLKEVKNYKEGELLSTKYIKYDENYIAPLSAYEIGKNHNKTENNDFICELEICPQPVGGIEEIESKIIYPPLAKQYQLEGSVLITAKINRKGIAKNIRVLQGLGLGCSEAAVEAVKKTSFIPGSNNGEIEESDVTFKLNFRISDEVEISLAEENLILDQTDTIISDIPAQNKFIKCDVEECPEPVGGITLLLKNLRYPPNAKRNNISGEVLLKVKVDELGFVVSAELIKGLGYGCDEAAKSAVIKTQFEPGKQDGKEVESQIEIIVPFIIGEE
jgi:TonB family protein